MIRPETIRADGCQYPDLQPQARFNQQITAILELIGEYNQGLGGEVVQSATWPPEPVSHHYELRRIMKGVRLIEGEADGKNNPIQTSRCEIDYYAYEPARRGGRLVYKIPQDPRPTERYATDDMQIVQLTRGGRRRVQPSPDEQWRVSSRALGMLAEIDQTIADDALNAAAERMFPEVAAVVAISSVMGDGNPFLGTTLRDSVAEFEGQVKQYCIEETVKINQASQLSERTSPLTPGDILDVEQLPALTRTIRRPFDLMEAANNLLQTDTGANWRTIASDEKLMNTLFATPATEEEA